MTEETRMRVLEAFEAVHKANVGFDRVWGEGFLFGWEWWASLALAIGPWVVWRLVRKPESADRLLYAGFFVITISLWLDFVGSMEGMWEYPVSLFPTIPSYIAWDFAVHPVAVMLLLQFRPASSPWWKALAFAAAGAFVIEPLFEWLGFYVQLKWKHIYSFPIYFAIFLVAHWLSRRTAFAPLAGESRL